MTRDSTIDQELAAGLASLRQQLSAALASVDALERQIVPSASHQTSEPDQALAGSPGDTPVRTDILIHNITSPALARSAQAQLANHPGVSRAEVRELAEGILRITVISDTAINADALRDWEPHRKHQVRTERPGVFEIELGETATDSATT